MTVHPGIEPASAEVEAEWLRCRFVRMVVVIVLQRGGRRGDRVGAAVERWSGGLGSNAVVSPAALRATMACREDCDSGGGQKVGNAGADRHFRGLNANDKAFAIGLRGDTLTTSMIRSTRQRRAILAALARGRRPLSPKEILAEAASCGDVDGDALPDLSLATVYRNLRSLLDVGEVVAVQLLGQPQRFEVAGLEHHHHFLCDRCDRMYDVAGCPGAVDKLAPRGFEVRGHEVMLNGVCDCCRRSALSASAPRG